MKGAIILLFILLVVAGCTQQVHCAPPNVLIGDTCCLDVDDNGLCDTWEEQDEEVELVIEEPEPAPVIEDDPVGDFAETFASTWNRKSYTALHSMFVKDVRMKFSSKEFNFLARRTDENLGVVDVEVMEIGSDAVKYLVMAGGRKETVIADVDMESGVLKHDGFYFFKDLNTEDACGTNESCYFTYALISGNRNWCDYTGDLKLDCVERFGVSKSITAKIDDCLTISEYYARAECLTTLAVKENNIEPCWNAGQDKQVFECMGLVAAIDEDVEQCDAFVKSRGYPGTRLQKTYCILGYVSETYDTKACALIDRRSDVVLGALQEGCYKLQFP